MLEIPDFILPFTLKYGVSREGIGFLLIKQTPKNIWELEN